MPNGILAKIESICRNFLWDGGVDYKRTPTVASKKVCKPKTEWGLGLKDDIIWNKAAIGKLVWWVTVNQDNMWVRWIHHIYIKDKDWQSYTPPSTASWYWRKICLVKDVFAQAYQQRVWTSQIGQNYTVAKGYDNIREKGVRVQWYNLVWNKWTIPKHSILAWIYHHNNMNTKAKLFDLGISGDNTRSICADDIETRDHLFFQCSYSKEVIHLVASWLGVQLPHSDLLDWRRHRRGSKLKRELTNAIINACIYQIWRQRNLSNMESRLLLPHILARMIIEEMRVKITASIKESMRAGDRALIRRLTDYER